MPTLYHRTTQGARILEEGFRDGRGSYGFASVVLEGVFVSDVPLDANEGAMGDNLLAVEIPDQVSLDDFEIVEEGQGYREWCVPAAVLNEVAVVRLLVENEED